MLNILFSDVRTKLTYQYNIFCILSKTSCLHIMRSITFSSKCSHSLLLKVVAHHNICATIKAIRHYCIDKGLDYYLKIVELAS